MNNQVTINKDNILNAYKQATEEQKELLENMFGKDIFKPKDIKDRIKTFDDAFHALGHNHELVKDYKNLIVCYCLPKDIITYAKLRIIAEALNEGWKPKFDGDECRYYPWFYVDTENEYGEFDEEKKSCHIPLRLNNFAVVCGGTTYVGKNLAGPFSYASLGVRLAFKTEELAEYCGEQFIEEWADFLFA